MTGASPIEVDLCVIGGGAGGLSVAMAAAAFGVPVGLIEKGEMGGARRASALPTAALVAAARRAVDIGEASGFGLDASLNHVDFAAVLDHARRAAADSAPDDSEARLLAMGVRVIRAPARFVDRRTIEAGGTRVAARRFIIATGSTPAIPPIAGLSETPFLTTDTVFDLAERPQRLIIIGGGPQAVALAQSFTRLGSNVWLLTPGPALAELDPEIARIALDRLALEGVRIREHARMESVRGAERSVAATFAIGAVSETIEGSHLLVAAGRRPAVEELELAMADVAFDASGIKVDRGLRTSNRKIYAIGDCAAGQPHLVHAASEHAALVIRSALFRAPSRVDARMTSRIVLTDPEIACCGLTEDQARAARSDVVTFRWPLADNDRARAERAIEGHVKVIATKRGAILGVAIVGRGAADMLPLWSLAIAKRKTLKDVADLVIPWPARSEIAKRAAIRSLAPLTQNPSVRRVITLLRRFG